MKHTTILLAATFCLMLFGGLLAQQDQPPALNPPPALDAPPAIDAPPEIGPLRIPSKHDESAFDEPRRQDPRIEAPDRDPTLKPRLVEPDPKAPADDTIWIPQPSPPRFDPYQPGRPDLNIPRSTVGDHIANQPLKRMRLVRQVIEYHLRPLTPQELKQQQRLRQLKSQLKSKDGDERKEASEQLKELLGEMFERDMKERQTMLSELEEKVKKLRQGYDARKQARNRIIGHQLEGMEMEAQGLEFPAEQAPQEPSVIPYNSTPSFQPPQRAVPVPGRPAPGVLLPQGPPEHRGVPDDTERKPKRAAPRVNRPVAPPLGAPLGT